MAKLQKKVIKELSQSLYVPAYYKDYKKKDKIAKVAALIVTFNRKELLKKTIDSILNQTLKVDKLFIVNNASTDGTDKFLIEIKNKYNNLIHVINLEENTGGSGGFSYGIKYIMDSKEIYDWIWLMDDDAFPEKFALEKMLKAYETLSFKKKDKIGVLQNEVTSNIEEISEHELNKKCRLRKRDFAIFVGFLIKTDVVKKIGYPKKEYFIYFDDIEYGFRVKKYGYKMYTVVGSKIYHPFSNFVEIWVQILFYNETKNMDEKKIIKKYIFKKIDTDGWRLYYHFRNILLTFKEHKIKYLFAMMYIYYEIFIWNILDKTKVDFINLAIKDAKKNNIGKTITPGQKEIKEVEK